MKQFILHYGVFAILLIMAVGLFLILNTFSIRQKTSVQIFITSTTTARAYIPPTPSMPIPISGDILHIVQTSGGDITFTVDTIRIEHNNIVLSLRTTSPINLTQQLGCNTYTQGYIYTKHIPLLQLIFKKY